ncbi:ABC transporter substrate-binding protein [Nitratireductor indicus]|uniref:ABC transporter substrate-binding protein n=1 Tax=Nitratireductor indicus TaxID=721133 RepID=UPI0028743637|nr:sugar ABC transporter substrate-binding protein [Nitratireductor indicus]MDS1137123.1 sugar ABC transporter substrate-binding protein [Nitratireductor indicus]
MKKILNYGVALALLATSGLSTVTAASAEELTFWTNLTTASQADVIKAQIDECRAEQDGLTVNFETIPFGSMYTRLITAMRNGSTPDIMNTLEGAVAFVQSRDGLVPLSDVVDELGRDDFRKSYLDAVSKDGDVWGLPDWALHQEVWYRKDLFEKAGIAIPKSWDELLAAAKKLTVDENGDGTPDVYGFAVPMGRSLVAPQTFFQFFYSTGGTIFDPQTGDYAFDKYHDEAVRALTFMLDLYKEASPPASVEWTWNDFRNGYVQGKLAMTNEWGAVVLIAAEQNPSMLDNMGVFPMPGPSADKPAAASLNGGYYYLVAKSTPERETAAKKLLKCMYTPERVAARANSRPIFAVPATQSAFDSETYQSNEYVKRFKPELETIFGQVMEHWYRYGQEAGLNPLTGQIEATTFIGDAIQSAALGRITPEEAITQIDSQLQYQISILGN